MDRETFRHVLALSGIGIKKAEALYEAGFHSIDDLRDASLEELMKVRGIGEKLAKRIKNAFSEKEEERKKIYICPNCGAFVSENDRICPKCGISLEGAVEPDEETEEITENLEEKAESEDEKDEHKLVICPECGAFVSESEKVCPKCGAILEGEANLLELKDDLTPNPDKEKSDADGYWYKKDDYTLLLCPNCGAFVSENDKICPRCGISLEGEEEIESDEEVSEIKENLEEKADGYWYKKDEHKLVMCPECGAFVSESEKVCPKCGAILEGEEEVKMEKEGEKGEVDGYWYKEGNQRLILCPNCGALMPENAEKCPHCGTVLKQSSEKTEEEREIEEEYSEEGVEEPEIRIESMGEGIEGLFSTKKEKKGVSTEFARIWENLTNGKPYGPETAMEESKPESPEKAEISEKRSEKGLEGTPHRTLYRGKGLTNGGSGLTNGVKRPGYRNGEIKFTNGRINGRTNGLTNGVTNGKGLINGGIVNGNGFINGGEKLPPEIIEEKPLKKSLVPITLLLVLMIVTPLLMSFLIMPVPKEINVGNGFGDWQDVIEYPDSVTDQPYDPNINFEALKVYSDWGGLALYLRIVQSGRLFETGANGVSSILAFIDADSSTATGYYIKGIGADYMIEVDGWNGTAHNHMLYSWNSSRSHDDWNGWVSEKSVPVYHNEREIETKVWIEGAENPKVVFASRDYFGNEDFSDVIISTQKGALRVDEFSAGPSTVSRGVETEMLRAEMSAYGNDVEIKELRFGITGDISELRLYEDSDRNGIYDSGDALIGTSIPENGEALFHVAINVNMHESKTFFTAITASATADTGQAVNIYLANVSVSQGSVTIVPHLTGGSYIEQVPASPEIDGSFHDWGNVLKNSDPAGDVIPSDNPNIDIANYALWPHDGLSFYVNVDGNMLGGEDMPFTKHRPRPVLDHDHDGIPDANDTYPYDFDNDGIPDSEDIDRDNDGINDNPGPDLWLNNTETGASIYIGPVKIPVLEGFDYVMLFIDIDGNMSTGYRAPWLPMGADYMVQVEGRAMRIRGSTLMRFNGPTANIWNWTEIGDANAAIGENQIECGISSDLNIDENSTFFFYMTDWEHNHDEGDGVLHGTRAASVTKTLHLHAGDVLNTTVGNSQTSTTIRDRSSHSWTQAPPFAEDFHVESATVSLYIGAVDNFPVPPTVYVYLEDNGNIIGSASSTVSTTGWAVFDMGSIDYTFPAGNTSTFVVYIPNTLGRTGITIYYDSADYDSRIDMETDTYIRVDSVKTYNGTVETDTFYPGDTVTINASISDPFGSYDISGARITITDPNGIVVVNNEYMNAGSSNESSILFSYNYTLLLNASSGEYSVSVTGIESNGVTAESGTSFLVPAYQAVVITPDSTSTASPDSFASYDLILKNIGEISDTYEITASQSTQYWRTELWYNGSEIAYDSDGDGIWNYVNASFDYDSDGIPEFNLSSFESANLTVKKYVPASSSGVSDTTDIFATSETDRNVSDSAKLTTNVPPTSPTKSLHLHAGDSMDTFPGSSTTSTTIGNGETHTWLQSDPFYTDFNITSYITAYLYISPTAATGWRSEGAPDVTVSLLHNGTSIGSDTITDLTGDGWYEFTIPVTDTVNILKGESIFLNISVSGAAAGIWGRPGYVDVYYDSADYDSRVVMPTDTYINVESIRTYNSSAETQIFQQGEKVHIVGNLSDPFGYNDIAGANITIIDPDGNVIVYKGTMNFLSGSEANASFYYDFQTNNTSTPGQYTIYVTGIESNGVTDTMEGNFIIPPEYGVSVYPDQTKEGTPNDVVDFLFTVQNIGNMNDTYEISLSPSTYGWRSELWNGTDEVAYDSNGDGVLDWVNPSYDSDGDGVPEFSIPSLEKINLTLKKFVPSNPGTVSDTTKLIATSETNSTVYDGAKATVNCPLAYPTKTLHFHSDDTLSTFQGTSTATLQISNDESHLWTQNPPFAMDFNITSYIPVYLYIDPTAATGWRNEGNPDVTVEISYGGTIIGSDTLSDIAGAGWYIFTVNPSSNITVPAGNAISINVSVSSAAGGTFGNDGYITLYYDSSDYDSRMEMSTDTVVSVDEIRTYNDTTETSIFSAGETVTIRSRVSDPLGAQDISGAQLYIVDPSGNVVVDWENMSLSSTDSANPPAWNNYSYNYSLPSDAVVGTYQIKVKGIESNGVLSYLSSEFYIPCGVIVEPNHTVNASSPSTVYFNHTITNTGNGADIYDIELISHNGYNVALYTSDGVLMGYDSNGDGVWDYVNSAYDLNGNGKPDTGILLPGESFNIMVSVEIPANVTGWENVTVYAESFYGSCSDTAMDHIYVPEFSHMLLPVFFALLLGVGVIQRRRERRKIRTSGELRQTNTIHK